MAVSTTAVEPQAAEGGGRVAIVFTPHEMYGATASTIESLLTSKNHTCVRVQLPEGISTQSSPTSTAPASKDTATPASSQSETAISSAPADPAVSQAVAQLTKVEADVLVSVGVSATVFTLDAIRDKPVIFCMVPNALDMPFMADDCPQRSRLAGVTTDISPEQQVDWVLRLHKGCKNLGVLYSDRSERTAKALVSPARARGLTVTLIETNRNEFLAAVESLDRRGCEGVLMLADAAIYNPTTIQRLLLWGLRQKKTVWAFSSNLTKAGAFAGLSADSRTMAEQTVQLVERVLEGAQVSKLGLNHPSRVETAVNQRTAEMIGIPLSKEILEQMTARFGEER